MIRCKSPDSATVVGNANEHTQPPGNTHCQRRRKEADGPVLPKHGQAHPHRGGSVATPPSSKVVAKLAASGVELTWLGHIGVFTLVIAAGLAALALVWALFRAVGWVMERARR